MAVPLKQQRSPSGLPVTTPTKSRRWPDGDVRDIESITISLAMLRWLVGQQEPFDLSAYRAAIDCQRPLGFLRTSRPETKTGAEAPVLVCSVTVYQAIAFCFLRRVMTPSNPNPASIMA